MRILRLKNLYLDALSALCRIGYCPYRIGFVIFDSNHTSLYAKRAHTGSESVDYLKRPLKHQSMVTRHVGLTFGAVEDYCIANLSRRQSKLYMRREACSAHSANTRIAYGRNYDGLIYLLNISKALDTIDPGIAEIVSNNHASRRSRAELHTFLNCNNLTRNTRMYRQASWMLSFAYNLTYQNRIAFFNDRCSRHA